MGGKQSVHIQTPEFNPSEWQYLIDQTESPEEYGLYRTLRHRKTGERINEYDFIWPDEDQYLYYLKSFNWRYRQSSVVNTRFIRLNNTDEICSHSYTAKVYVEAVKVRISQISDIPYPDNLYVLMESLEGFSKIYEHSKYFEIEENQICVDDYGNVKIWVNSDLSINFPNSQIDCKQKGQEDMVEMIVQIIAANTDPETEPNHTFKEFYDQKKGRGKRFEQAKVMVLNYARLQNTEIPDKFQAILNMDKQEHQDINSVTDNSNPYKANNYYDRNQPHQFERWGVDNNQEYDYYPQQYQEQPRQIYPSYQHQHHPFPYNQQYPPYPQQYIQQPPIYSPLQPAPLYHQSYAIPPPPLPPQNGPIYYIPTYPRVEYPLRPVNTINQIPNPFPQGITTVLQPQNNPPQVETLPSNSRLNAPTEQEQSSSNLENMRGTIITSLNQDTGNFKGERNQYQQAEQIILQNDITTEKQNRNTHLRNNSFGDQNHSISEADDLVARSLPIKAGYPSQHNQQLATMGQNDRAIYSHINPKDQWAGNKDGFGLTNNPQLKLKESAHKTSKGKTEVNPIKYFYSMDEQLEIDPVIAADMARYLN